MFNGIKQFGSNSAAAAKVVMLQNKIKHHKTVLEDDGVKVIISGDGKLKELFVDGENMNKAVKVINEAITKAQKYMAGEMEGSMGDLSKVLASMPKGMGF